jgi:uncharacterized membrane protein YfcA
MKKSILISLMIGTGATILFSAFIYFSQGSVGIEKVVSAFIGSSVGSFIGLYIKNRKVQI